MERLLFDYLDGPALVGGSAIKSAYEILNPTLASHFSNQRIIQERRYRFNGFFFLEKFLNGLFRIASDPGLFSKKDWTSKPSPELREYSFSRFLPYFIHLIFFFHE